MLLNEFGQESGVNLDFSGVTWMSNLHKYTRLGGSGGMLPQEIFRN